MQPLRELDRVSDTTNRVIDHPGIQRTQTQKRSKRPSNGATGVRFDSLGRMLWRGGKR